MFWRKQSKENNLSMSGIGWRTGTTPLKAQFNRSDSSYRNVHSFGGAGIRYLRNRMEDGGSVSWSVMVVGLDNSLYGVYDPMHRYLTKYWVQNARALLLVTGGVIYFLILIKISNNARSRLHMFSARLDAVLMFLTMIPEKTRVSLSRLETQIWDILSIFSSSWVMWVVFSICLSFGETVCFMFSQTWWGR